MLKLYHFEHPSKRSGDVIFKVAPRSRDACAQKQPEGSTFILTSLSITALSLSLSAERVEMKR